MNSYTAQQNVDIAMSVGKHWLDLLRNIRTQRRTRAELIDDFRELRRRMAKIHDHFTLNMDLDEARNMDMSRVARTKACPDCEDKFTCLTRGEKLRCIRRCIFCGKKVFYEVNENGVSDHDGYAGGSDLCPLSVRAGSCDCGFVDNVDPRHMTNWLKAELTEISGYKLEFVRINEFQQRYDYTYGTPPRREDHIETFEHKMFIDRLVRLLRRAKEPTIMTLSELGDLVMPGAARDIESDTPGFSWPSNIKLAKNMYMVHEIANMYHKPPASFSEAMTIRDEADPSERANVWLTNQRWLWETKHIQVFRPEDVFGPFPPEHQEPEFLTEHAGKFCEGPSTGVTVRDPVMM